MKSFKEFLLEKVNLEDEISKLNLNNENDIWKGIELICKNSKYTGYESYEPTCFKKPFRVGEWIELFTEEILAYKKDKKYFDYEVNIASILFKQDKKLLDKYLNEIFDIMGIYDLSSLVEIYDLSYESSDIDEIEEKIEKEFRKRFISAKKENDLNIELILNDVLKYNESIFNAINEEFCIPEFFESFWAGFIGEYYRNMNDFCKAMRKAIDRSIYKKDILKNMKEFISSGDYKNYLK